MVGGRPLGHGAKPEGSGPPSEKVEATDSRDALRGLPGSVQLREERRIRVGLSPKPGERPGYGVFPHSINKILY